ncbi:hypothetical protein ELI29_29745 (plasmid) [Rhizobium leguminosarum]|nr:hypothetical protein ELI29_29745 [Rhizobium leguminosarum]
MKGVPCGPLIRPCGPLSPRWGEEGVNRCRFFPRRTLKRGVATILFSPAGRRCRQADEGATGPKDTPYGKNSTLY